jgi:hypothetical protein
MSELTKDDTVYVYLMNEGSDAWRPVPSRHRSGDFYLLGSVEGVDLGIDEEWEFAPGTLVKVARRTLRNGKSGLVAIAKVAALGDTFTFSMLIQAPPSIQLRQSLLQELPTRVPQWVGEPREAMIFDPSSSAAPFRATWSDAQEVLNRRLDGNTLAFVYYGGSAADPWHSNAYVSEYARSAVYSVTIPASVHDIGPEDVAPVMIELHHWLESNRTDALILGGDLGVIEKECAEAPDGPRRAAEDRSVEWLCCLKSDVHAFLDLFEVAVETDSIAVCRRRRR